MSDNTQLNLGIGGDLYRSEDVGGGVKIGVVKLHNGAAGADGGAITSANPLDVKDVHATSAGAPTRVVAATASTSLVAAGARKALILSNDSTATLYVLCGTGTADTTSSWSFKVLPGQTVTIRKYDGALKGIWSAANGGVQVTEWF